LVACRRGRASRMITSFMLRNPHLDPWHGGSGGPGLVRRSGRRLANDIDGPDQDEPAYGRHPDLRGGGLRRRPQPSPRLRACAARGSGRHPAYWTSAVLMTSARKCRLRSCAVRRSTCRPPINAESSASIRAMPSRPGDIPGSNSTSRSTSLSCRAVPFRTDPNSESRLIWCRRQSAASAARSANRPSAILPPPHQTNALHDAVTVGS